MSGTFQKNQYESEELKKFREEKLNSLSLNFVEKRSAELEEIKKESKQSEKQNTKILEKHFHDRTLQPFSDFPEVKKKEVGCSSGFQAEHKYSNDESDNATFMIKSVLNRTLTEKDKQTKLEQFKESFYKGSRKATKLQDPSLIDSYVDFCLDQTWEQRKCNICYDDLNIADFVREYIAGDLYKLLLHDRAPIVELVISNDLPKKRFVKDKEQNSTEYKPGEYIYKEELVPKYEKGKYKFNDQFKQLIEEDKAQKELHLRSKFLNEFTTLMNLKEKGEDYQSATGFEKILATRILLGEVDIRQSENFGVIKKDGKKLWSKIDHGRSFYSCVDHWRKVLLYDFEMECGVKVDYKILASELRDYAKFFSENNELTDRLIDKKVAHLNQILNPKMKFTLRYISLMPTPFCEEVFSYSDQSKEFISDKGNSLGSYFKQRLQNQVKVMKEYSEILLIMSAISNDFQDVIRTLPAEFFYSQHKDPLIWVIETGKKLDGKDPIIWAIDSKKNIDGKDPIIWAIDSKKNIDGKDPIIWAIDSKKNIDGKDPIIWAIDSKKNIDGKDPVIWAISSNKEIEEKKPVKWAVEHNLLINNKNPEIFASKVQLTKFVDKASLLIIGIAAITLIGCIIAELSLAWIIPEATVALVAAITKSIVAYVQKDLLENSVVSSKLGNLSTERPKVQVAGPVPS